MILLDTSAIIDYVEDTEEGRKIREYFEEEIGVASSITVNETLITATKKEKEKFENLFSQMIIAPFDYEAALKSIEIEKQLMKNGKMIGKIDICIAAIAFVRNLPIMTLDSDFKKIEGLKVIFIE